LSPMTSPGAYSLRCGGSAEVPFTCVIGGSTKSLDGTYAAQDTPESVTKRFLSQELCGSARPPVAPLLLFCLVYFGGLFSCSAYSRSRSALACSWPRGSSLPRRASDGSPGVRSSSVWVGNGARVSAVLRAPARARPGSAALIFRRVFMQLEARSIPILLARCRSLLSPLSILLGRAPSRSGSMHGCPAARALKASRGDRR
jgi:hypothetical protein